MAWIIRRLLFARDAARKFLSVRYISSMNGATGELMEDVATAVMKAAP
jgi:hypothetical protein